MEVGNMKYINDITNEEVKNPDLSAGYLSAPTEWASPTAYETIDNITKFALGEDDYETVCFYHVWTEDEIAAMERTSKIQEQEKYDRELLDSMDAIICELYEMVIGGDK